MPRKYQKKTEGPSYTKEDLKSAVTDVQNKNKTYRQAAATYGVPISVISQRLNERNTSVDSLGQGRRPALTTKMENKIVDCIIERARMGYPYDRNELMTLVGEYVNTNGILTPFKDGKPGIDWYYSFMKRHDLLTLKKPEHLQKCKKDARKSDIIYDFYEKLKSTLDSLNITDQSKACFYFNADETAFPSDPNRLRAIGEKGKVLSRISGGSGRENTTVLACVAADGTALPPMIVFKAACVQARWTSEQAYPDTLYAATKNGWMEEPPFYEWFCKGFIRYVERIRTTKNFPKHPAVVLYDGHCSHISLRIIEKAMDKNVTLIKLASHVTDKLQPLDKCVFGPLKIFWDKLLVAHGKNKMCRGSGRLSKQQFSEFLGKAWAGGMKSDNIVSGFKTTGIFPVDASKFPESEFSAKILEEWKVQLQQTPNENDMHIDLDQASIDSSGFYDEVDLEPTILEKLNPGNFILVSFKYGTRKTHVFKFICVVEKIDGSDGSKGLKKC